MPLDVGCQRLTGSDLCQIGRTGKWKPDSLRDRNLEKGTKGLFTRQTSASPVIVEMIDGSEIMYLSVPHTQCLVSALAGEMEKDNSETEKER